MKKMLCLLAFVGFTMVSCNNDDNGTVTPDTTVQDPVLKNIVGKWKFNNFKIYQNGNLVQEEDGNDPLCGYDFIEFKADGSKIETLKDNENNCAEDLYPGTYVYDKPTKIISLTETGENTPSVKFEVLEMTTTTAKVSLIEADGQVLPDNITAEIYLTK